MNGFYRLFVADRRVVVGFASALDDLYGLAAFGCSSSDQYHNASVVLLSLPVISQGGILSGEYLPGSYEVSCLIAMRFHTSYL